MTAPVDPLLPCPSWCHGDHAGQEDWPGDRFHESKPVRLDLRGPVDVEAECVISQYPLSPCPDHRSVYGWCHIMATATMKLPSDMVAFADMLTGYADRLREFADEPGHRPGTGLQ